MENNWIPENAKLAFSWQIFDVYQWEQEMFDWSKQIFEKIKREDTVDVIAILETWEIIILEEKQPWREVYYWLVWWTCESWEEPIETAKRELLEETWLVSNDWELFNSYKLSSKIAFNSNIFIARNCKKIQEQNIEEDWEKIKVIKLGWSDFLDTIASYNFKVKEFALEVLREIYLGNEEKLFKRIFKNN